MTSSVFADIAATKRYQKGDDWIVLRTELSKGDNDLIVSKTGRPLRITPEGQPNELGPIAPDAMASVFSVLAKDWSFDRPCSRENYEALRIPQGEWVDECLDDAVGVARGEIEGKEPSPVETEQPSDSQSSSPPEDESPSID